MGIDVHLSSTIRHANGSHEIFEKYCHDMIIDKLACEFIKLDNETIRLTWLRHVMEMIFRDWSFMRGTHPSNMKANKPPTKGQ